jgi:hypothetical protein
MHVAVQLVSTKDPGVNPVVDDYQHTDGDRWGLQVIRGVTLKAILERH